MEWSRHQGARDLQGAGLFWHWCCENEEAWFFEFSQLGKIAVHAERERERERERETTRMLRHFAGSISFG
jgi:hypothetical protein